MNIDAKLVKELRERTQAGLMDCKAALTEASGDLEKAIEILREKGIAKANKKADKTAAEGVAHVGEKDGKVVIFEFNSQTDFVSQNDAFLKLVNDISDIALENDLKNEEEVKTHNISADKTVSDLIIDNVSKIGENLQLRRLRLFSSSNVIGFYKHMNSRIAVVVELEGGDVTLAKDIAMHAAALNPQFASEDQIDSAWIAKERKILTQQTIDEGKPENIVEKIVDGKMSKQLQEVCLVNQKFVKNPDITIKQLLDQNNAKLVDFVRFEVGEGIEIEEVDFAAEVASQVASFK